MQAVGAKSAAVPSATRRAVFGDLWVHLREAERSADPGGSTSDAAYIEVNLFAPLQAFCAALIQAVSCRIFAKQIMLY
jgi:hypothetical protein